MYFNTTGKVEREVLTPAILKKDTMFKFIGSKNETEIKKGTPVATVYRFCARFQLEFNSATSEFQCADALKNLFEIYGDKCADYEFSLLKMREHFPKLFIRDMAIQKCWKFYQYPADGKGTILFSEPENVLEKMRQSKIIQSQNV